MIENKFMNNLIKFAIGPLGAAVIGFITVPITTWLVNPEQFGLTTMFTLVQTLITSFIYLGIDQAYVREYNNYKGSKENLFYNAILIPGIVSILMMIFTFIYRYKISLYLFSEVNMILMYIFVLWIPINVIERFLLLNIRMQENGIKYSIFNILLKGNIMVLTIFFLLFFEKNYASIIMGTMLGQIITCMILIISSKDIIYKKKLKFDKDIIKSMLIFGLPILPSVVIVWILKSIDRISLSHYSTIAEIGIYFAAMKLVAALNIIQSIFATFWVPMAYRWHEEDVDKKYFEQVSYVLCVLMSLLFIGILLFKEFFIWILSPEYSEAQYILPFLLFTPIMYTMSETTTLGIAFSRKTHYNIWISLIAAIINIMINVTLVPILGGIGAAIGTGIAYISFFWSRTLISRRYWYKFDLKFYLINTMLLLIIATLNIIIKSFEIYLINCTGILLCIFINLPFILSIFDVKNRRKAQVID